MANIPHSSRYRTVSNKASANAGAAGRSSSAQKSNGAQGRVADQPSGTNWFWALMALGLLIAFPYQVLGVIGLGLIVSWLFGKK